MGIIDDVDARIIRTLQRDSRTSLKDISRMVGISIPTVRSRIRQLENLGVIKQFTVAIDPKMVGGVMALIHLNVEFPDIQAVCKKLSEIEEVLGVYLVTGEYNVIIKVYTPDMRAFEEFITHKLSKIQGIKHVHSSTIMEILKEIYGPALRPGFGIQVSCRYCRKGIVKDPVKKTINGKTYYFCCNTCATAYQEKFVKKQVPPDL